MTPPNPTRPENHAETPADSRFPVAYISHYFPALTQTFVYREIQALERRGWRVAPFSIRRPTKGISDEARELASRTWYLIPVRWGRFLWRQVALFLCRPLRYLAILLDTITRPGESLRSRLHGLTHFFGGMYLVPEVRERGVRHFHAHFGQNPATLAMVASEYLGIPFSMTIHARDLFVDTALLRTKILRAKFVATISGYNAAILAGMTRDAKAAARIHVVHCGVDVARFAPREAPVARPRPLFLAVGRLVAKKGYVYLVEAAARLKDHGVPFEVRIIGGGPDREALLRRISELSLGSHVRLDGPMPQEKLVPILRDADVFVLPCALADDGDQDGIPVSLMEAMACGIPCISTGISGIPELIESGREGLLVPQKDVGALAEAMRRLALDPALRSKLGSAGRGKVEAQFTLEGEAAALERLILGAPEAETAR